jgi:hypothetical protein
VACLLKASRDSSLLGNGSVNTTVPVQWLSSLHVIDTVATVEELLFSVLSMLIPYYEGQPPLPGSQLRAAVVRSEKKLVAEDGEHPSLEAATKQRNEGRD